MNFAVMLKRLEKLTIDNSPAILTALGITGTLTTAYLTGKASVKAYQILSSEEVQSGYTMDNRDVVKLTWKLYIPAAVTGTLTIASIIGANHVSSRRATAMAAAYSISERAFTEYKEKVIEKIGDNKERAVRDEIAQDRVNKNPVSENTVVITNNGDVLCYDQFTGRYFNSSMEALKKAENDLNHQILHDGYASLSELYDLLGLQPTSFSDEVGWNHDYLLDIKYSTVMSPDDRPCIAIDFDLRPSRDFQYFAKF